MAGRSLVPASTSGRGCLFILVAVIVLGLGVAAAVALLNALGPGAAVPTSPPVAAASAGAPAGTAAPAPSITPPAASPTAPQPSPTAAQPSPTSSRLQGPRVSGSLTGAVTLAFAGRAPGACPVLQGVAVYGATDDATASILQVNFKAYHGADTYPVTSQSGSTYVGLVLYQPGSVSVYRSTSGTIQTTAGGSGTITADLVATKGAGRLHFEGVVSCP
jgi:hypothetical protein